MAASTIPLADEQFVLLTTFRKSGEPKPTPVWIAAVGAELAVITLADAWKVRRARATPRVTLQPCDMRGRVADGAPTYSGTARVTDAASEMSAVRSAMNRKYLLARVGNLTEAVLGGLMGRKPRVGIMITLDPTEPS